MGAGGGGKVFLYFNVAPKLNNWFSNSNFMIVIKCLEVINTNKEFVLMN